MNAGENLLLEQDVRLKAKMSVIKYKIIVISGKGGVGKTSVAVNLAYALSLIGKKVAILDVDLHGPNIAKMLGVEDKSLGEFGTEFQPVEVNHKLKAVSLALTGNNLDQPAIWRGPMKSLVIKRFLADINWGELDYLVIDSPPGTGDEPLSVCQSIPGLTGAVIVTTPQDVAVMDARKSIQFCREIKIPVIGVIENMSGFICPHCGKETNIFRKGGGKKSAFDMKVVFLGSVPFQAEFVEYADKGVPFVSFKEKLESARVFLDIVEKIKLSVGDTA